MEWPLRGYYRKTVKNTKKLLLLGCVVEMISESSFFTYHGKNGIAISRSVPSSWNGERCIELAPSWDLLNEYKRTGNEKRYTERYQKEVLDKLDKAEMKKKLAGKVLLCWCKPGQFCHRHLVLKWLNE